MWKRKEQEAGESLNSKKILFAYVIRNIENGKSPFIFASDSIVGLCFYIFKGRFSSSKIQVFEISVVTEEIRLYVKYVRAIRLRGLFTFLYTKYEDIQYLVESGL